jgi:hypothetical protein
VLKVSTGDNLSPVETPFLALRVAKVLDDDPYLRPSKDAVAILESLLLQSVPQAARAAQVPIEEADSGAVLSIGIIRFGQLADAISCNIESCHDEIYDL